MIASSNLLSKYLFEKYFLIIIKRGREREKDFRIIIREERDSLEKSLVNLAK